MTWFTLALSSALVYAGSRIVARLLLRRDGDALMFTAIHNGIAGLILLPLVGINLHWPIGEVTWLYFGMMIVFAFLSDWFSFRALKTIDVSEFQLIDQLRQALIVIAGLVFWNESLTTSKIMGIILIIAGVAITVVDRKRMRWNGGAAWAFASMFMATIAVIFTKLAVVDFSEAAMASIELIVIAFLSLGVARFDRRRFIGEWQLNGRGIAAAGVLFGLAELFDFMALRIGEASRVVPIFQTSVVFAAVGGILLLDERERLFNKIIGTVFIVIGVSALYFS